MQIETLLKCSGLNFELAAATPIRTFNLHSQSNTSTLMSLRLHNTLTGRLEEFVPLEPGQRRHVRLRRDGLRPLAHRARARHGHLRRRLPLPALSRLRRHLRPQLHRRRRQDHRARQAAGIAALDAGGGEHPLPSPRTCTALGCAAADVEPRATEHIAEMIALIQELDRQGPGLRGGRRRLLRRRQVPGLRQALEAAGSTTCCAGARVEVDERKRHPLDFALWKAPSPASRRGTARGARAVPAGTSSARP